MNTVKIKKNPYGDNRYAPKDTTFEQFHKANLSHIYDVQRVMHEIANELTEQGKKHDWTKLVAEQEFFDDFKHLEPKDFVKGKWYTMHCAKEAHHPFSNCHDDITLFDILECIADCICAGKARSGEVRPMEFDAKILEKAVKNTVKLIDHAVEVVDEEKKS